jgi:hypothetical protein
MTELLNVFTNNIWLIILLTVMFIRRPYRIAAMIILATKAAFNVVPAWLILIMIIIGILIDIDGFLRAHPTTTRNHEKKGA